MMRWLVFAIVCSGCGRIDFDVTIDARGDDDAAVLDGADDATDAQVTSWGPPELISELVFANDYTTDVAVTADELEMYFVLRVDPTMQGRLMVSKRTSVTDPWGAPTNVGELETGGDEANPQVSGDGLRMYFASIRASGIGAHDIYYTERANRTAVWGTPSHVLELNTANDDSSPGRDDSERHLVLARFIGDWELATSSRATTAAPWSTPSTITELETPGVENTPNLDASGLVLHFASDRGPGGDYDLYVATRPDVTAPFGAPRELTTVNTETRDADPWLSADGNTLYFESDATGKTALWRSRRQ